MLAFAFGFNYDGDEDPTKYEISMDYPKLVDSYGIVSGVMFALPLSITGIFIGALIPRMNRKCVFSFASILWSVMTYLQGQIHSYSVYLVFRVLSGIVMSACNPLAYSLIRDYFPPNKRSTANSIFSSGIYVGNALASIQIVIINEFGWRFGYMGVGIICVFFGVLGLILLQEPPSNQFT